MTGIELKEKLTETRYSMADIARKLGIKPQDLNALFNVKDTKTGTIERLSDALELPIAYFYGEAFGSVQIHGNHIATGDNTVNSSDDRLMNLLVSKDEQLTMAMKQTSKAQDQMDKAQSQMDRVLDKFCGKVEG